jgi:hypothetical protein
LKQEREGRGRRQGEPTPSQARRSEQKQTPQQRGEGVRGIPPPQGEQAKPQHERGERHPAPDVWDLVERRVRNFEVPSSDPEYYSKFNELNRLKAEIMEKGTGRDKDILALLHFRKGGFFGILPEELQKFRAKVAPLSDEKVAEELRKAVEAERASRSSGAFYSGIGLDEFAEPLYIKMRRPKGK